MMSLCLILYDKMNWEQLSSRPHCLTITGITPTVFLLQDETTLIMHQKTKHFKCEVCNRKLTSAHALCVHSLQVHKVTVTQVPDAKVGRESPEWEIFGSSGIPVGMEKGMDPPSRPGAPPPPGAAGMGPGSGGPMGMGGPGGMPPNQLPGM
jgi:hypothetical protein